MRSPACPWIAVVALVTGAASHVVVTAQTQPAAQPAAARDLMSQALDEQARLVIARRSADDLEVASLIGFAVVEAIGIDEPLRRIGNALAETARTDAQVGATATAGGTTSVAERAGLPSLVAFAIEHNLIQQSTSGTTFTLTASPYAFAAAVDGDTSATYRQFALLRRFAASASFAVQQASDPLSNVSGDQLNEWSVRVRLTGDRSTRSAEYGRFWNEKLGPAMKARVATLSGLFTDALTALNAAKRGASAAAETALRDAAAEYVRNTASPSETELEARLRARLIETVIGPIRNGDISIAPDVQQKLRIAVMKLPAVDAAIQEARPLVQEWIDEQTAKVLLTFEYTQHRSNDASDYSSTRLLYEQGSGALKVTGNVGLSFYQSPDAARNQQSLRDFVVAATVEGTARSPFVASNLDNSRTTISLDGRYERLPENRGIAGKTPNLGVVQFKVDVPLAVGVSLPLSVSWATATELVKEHDIRGHIGLTLNTDKLAAVAQALAKGGGARP